MSNNFKNFIQFYEKSKREIKKYKDMIEVLKESSIKTKEGYYRVAELKEEDGRTSDIYLSHEIINKIIDEYKTYIKNIENDIENEFYKCSEAKEKAKYNLSDIVKIDFDELSDFLKDRRC